MHEEEVSQRASIDEFFTRNGLSPQVRLDCHDYLEKHFPGQHITPVNTQGYCSYTLIVSNLIVQFRPPNYKLDLSITTAAKEVYGKYAPAAEFLGTLEPHGLLLYTMEKVPGISYAKFTTTSHRDALQIRQTLCHDLALFFSLAWYNTPSTRLPAGKIASSVQTRLELLSAELPSRFQPIAKQVLEQLPLLDILPKVLTHGDIVPSNIMLDPRTGRLEGVVDWAEAEMLPFGMGLYGVEEILGHVSPSSVNHRTISSSSSSCFTSPATPAYQFIYHPQASLARSAFWTELKALIPEFQDGRFMKAVRAARTVGILLWYGIAFDDGMLDRVVSEGRDRQEIAVLDALLLGEGRDGQGGAAGNESEQ